MKIQRKQGAKVDHFAIRPPSVPASPSAGGPSRQRGMANPPDTLST